MKNKNTRIVIVGAGNVGATTAFSIMNQGLCDELILIDINHEKAYGEALDLQHAVSFVNRNVKIRAGEYSDCRDADIVVITACAPMDPNTHDRLKMLAASKRIMKSVVESIMENGFDGIILVVSNPVDIMSYYAWKLSGLPHNQIIGSGTTLDTARMAGFVADMFELDARSVELYMLGEHGDSSVTSWGSASIGGKKFADVMKDNSSRAQDMTKEMLQEKTVKAGWDIFSRKGTTTYGVAAAVTGIVKSIMFDENRIYPVSVYLNGEYGLKDVYLSAPAIINRTGAKEIVEIKLEKEEQEALERSSAVVKSYYQDLNL